VRVADTTTDSATGDSAIVNVEDRTGYCRYDFRAVFENGRQVTRRAVNVCEVSRWVIG